MAEDQIPKAFMAVFRDVVIAFQPRALDRDAARVYHAALGGLPIGVVRDGALRVMQTRPFFPTVGEWFQAATDILRDQRRELAATPVDVQQVECAQCTDTGSVYAECPGDATCGRQHRHGAHAFVCVCACRSTNRTYQQRRASQVLRGGEV